MPVRPPVARRWRGLIALLAVVTIGAGLVTLALWQSQGTHAAIVTAGDLSLTLGDLTWQCPEQCASGQASQLGGLTLGPGQSVQLKQDVTSDFVGDNLMVSLSVALSGVPQDWDASWSVETAGAPWPAGAVPLGQTVVVGADLAGAQRAWSVVVTLTASDEAVWADPASVATADPAVTDLGQLTITANQVRCGTGFDTACAPEDGRDD